MKGLRRIVGKLRDRVLAGELAHRRATLDSLDDLKALTGRALVDQQRTRGLPKNLHDVEFKVFSQFGDDGIIQYLIRHVTPPPEPSFVEFGVEDYQESNTRFLLVNDNWRGLVMDGSAANIASIRNRALYWRHDLTAAPAFITRENVDRHIRSAGFSGAIGLLSIDIDGNDYWVWQGLEAVDPAIVAVEYNSLFGSARAVTVPYDPAFRRDRAHFSQQYWGCSLRALCRVAARRGYALVGCNSAGNNAYFVKENRLGAIPARRPQEAFVLSRFRDARDALGRLSYVGGRGRIELIRDLQVYDVDAEALVRIEALLNDDPVLQ